MRSRTVVIRNPGGIHARPARRFAEAALTHAAEVRLRKGGEVANGKSVLAMLTLGLKCNDVVTVEIDDHDEEMLARLGEIIGQIIEEDDGERTLPGG